MINASYDTIVAISTPPGTGAIGIVRLTGTKSIEIIKKIFLPQKINSKGAFKLKPNIAKYGYIKNFNDNNILDEVIITFFQQQHSFTGEDLIEISCHGNPLLMQKIIDHIIRLGARIAEPGEFTYRAFLNDRIDLTQAEAVADIIEAKSDAALKLSIDQLTGNLSNRIKEIYSLIMDVYSRFVMEIDFPEEEIPTLEFPELIDKLQNASNILEELIETVNSSIAIRNGFSTPIVGKPNVGKSSLFNFFVNQDRVIVSDIPGTTRDSIEEQLLIKGNLFRFIDTAGLRKSNDPIEMEGVQRTMKIVQKADLLIILLDPTSEINETEKQFLTSTSHIQRIIAYNKIDLINPNNLPDNYENETILKISLKEKINLENFKDKLTAKILSNNVEKNLKPALTNIRQKQAAIKAVQSIKDALIAIKQNLSPELIASDIEIALNALNDLLGNTTSEDVLKHIFNNFCIGK